MGFDPAGRSAYDLANRANINNFTNPVFQSGATLPSGFKNAFKKIELYGVYDKTKQYSIYAVKRKNASNAWQVQVMEDTNTSAGIAVCQFNVTGYAEPSDGIDVLTLTEMNQSGITGKVWIDWSKIAIGTNSFAMYYATTGLDAACYNISTPDDIIISLPKYIPAVVGKEVNIYYDNVIHTTNLNNYVLITSCSSMNAAVQSQQVERWTAIPDASGDFFLQITAYKNGNIQVATATTTVRVAAASAGTGLTKHVLVLGDSMTNDGNMVTELLNLFGASDPMDIVLHGTRGTAPNLHEGRNGWSIKNYLNDDTYNGFTNPFRNAGVFDLANYMTVNSITQLDHFIIALGTNDISNDPITTAIGNLAVLISKIQTWNSSCNIHIFLTIPPSGTQDGWGGTNGQYFKRTSYKRLQFGYVQTVLRDYKGLESGRIYLVPVNVNIDTKNNFPTTTVNVNSRNTTQVVRQNNNVHPAQSGYFQMADILYYHLKSFGLT